jgi:hypothetical protein
VAAWYSMGNQETVMPKTTTTKPKTAKRTTKKPTTAASRNGKRPAKRKPTLEELTLRSFRAAYEANRRKTA